MIDTTALVERIAQALTGKGLTLALAESCTGGLVSHLVTNLAGSSDWYQGGAVTYSNRAKTDLLEVPEETLQARGAVSRETVLAMAAGARRAFGSDWAVAVSGIAGPGGGSPDKPVGMVWMAWAGPDGAEAELFRFSGGRQEIKAASAAAALEGLLTRLESRIGEGKA